MSLTLIRAQIKSVLEDTVTPGGKLLVEVAKIHDYWRHVVKESVLSRLFTSPTRIFHTWLITRTAVEDKLISANLTAQCYLRTHSIKVWGFYGLKDSTATSKTFDGVVDAVMDALRTALELPSPLSGTAFNATQPQASPFNEGHFVGILSHSCQITFTVIEYITPA